MKKYGWIVLLVITLTVGGVIYFYNSSSKQDDSNYSAKKSSTNNTLNMNTSSNSSLGNITATMPKTPIETEIASFSTKIQNKKDTNRQGNITITCSALNGTIVSAR